MTERVAIYCRLSEEDRDKEGADSQSICNQKALLRQYAQAHGWKVVAELSDDDYAGADRNRPAFRALIAGAEQGAYDIILCKTQSRFTREIELVEHYLHDCFPRWGVRFVSVVDNADTAVHTNKKSRQIHGLINEWYLEDLSENIRAVLTSRRKSGLHIGSTALYGYQKDADRRGHLRVDPVTAPVVREVFDWYAQGVSQTAIAQKLNERGEPSPAARKGRAQTLWRASTIGAMLRNAMYRGTLVQGRYGSESYKTRRNRPRPKEQWYCVPDTHEPLISQEVWEQVQQRLNCRVRPSHTPAAHRFSGKVFCQSCGAPLCITTTRGVRYLQCSARHAGKDCEGAFVAEMHLQQAVAQAMRELLDRYQTQLQTFVEQMEPMQHNGQGELEQCRAAQMRYQNSLQMLYLDQAAGRVRQADGEAIRQRLTGDLNRLDERIKQLEHQVLKIEQKKENPQTQWELPEQMLPRFVSRILVGRRATGTREVPVTIEWAF